ncbi:nitrilase-related carbon-nitrogen hydrolase [Flavobacterium piscinae]|uniref:nitrilase-related carbon-nitrogen hydrolase n=1 Tax=Flavobacterium piscinae TaxID=2506424 RepID=UPI002AAB9B18|nr:nitrilase-related carbon-nitrogen hydrolase [Flavobacterium piscinae]
MKLKIATSQFSVSSDIVKNKSKILKQIKEAKEYGAQLIHFPEGSLSGYAGVDFESFTEFDWKELVDSTLEILQEAKKK